MMDALPKVNEELHNDPLLGEWQGEIRIGIGLNTGDTLVGNIGSDQRFNYSVLGDTVNVSARLEGQTKDYAVPVLVGEATKNQAMAAQAAQIAPLAFLELDLIALKGKAVPERIYTVLVARKSPCLTISLPCKKGRMHCFFYIGRKIGGSAKFG